MFYVCSLIEFIGRKTKNKRKEVVNALGEQGIIKQLYDAQANHCLSFEQVSDELIEKYQIPYDNFDTISDCKYKVPSFTAIGKLYSHMIDEISDFKTGIYFENPSYLEHSYQEGCLLA